MEETEEIQVEQVEVPEVQTEQALPVNNVDHNWKQAQEVMSLQKREIEALKEQMQRLSAAPPVVEEPDEFETADPDDYVTMGKAREMAKKMAAREAKAEARKLMNEYQQSQNIVRDEERARGRYEDYDYIIEHYAVPMIKNDPALAYQVQMSKNPAETAYKLGRLSDKFEESSVQKTSPKAEKVLKNSARPVSSHSSTASLKQQSDVYSKMSRDEIWAQSQEFARRA